MWLSLLSWLLLAGGGGGLLLLVVVMVCRGVCLGGGWG